MIVYNLDNISRYIYRLVLTILLQTAHWPISALYTLYIYLGEIYSDSYR